MNAQTTDSLPNSSIPRLDNMEKVIFSGSVKQTSDTKANKFGEC